MAFIAISEILKNAGKEVNPRGRQNSSAGVICATDKHGNNRKGPRGYSLRISLSSKIAKEARIIAGDRVDILFDRDSKKQQGMIVRVVNGGWKIGVGGGVKHTSPTARLVVKMTYIPGMPSFPAATECPSVVMQEGILFDLPSNCSFTENVRKEK